MKKIILILLSLVVFASCCKDEDYEVAPTYKTFVYEDQTQHVYKFGITIVHSSARAEAVDVVVWSGGREYRTADFTWRYGRGEMEGILLSPSKLSYPQIKYLSVRIGGHWYSVVHQGKLSQEAVSFSEIFFGEKMCYGVSFLDFF